MHNLVLGIFFLFWINGARAISPVIRYTDTSQVLKLGRNVLILEDINRDLTPNEVLNSTQFVENKQALINLPTSNSFFWLYFRITNKTSSNNILLELADPTIDKATCFTFLSRQEYFTQEVLENISVSERNYRHQNYFFELSIPKNETRTYLIKVESVHSVSIPLLLGSEQQLLLMLLDQDYLFGIYSGIMLIMILYNLFVFFSVKDHSYLVYVIYVFFIALTQATLYGYASRYLWPSSPWLTTHAIFIAPALSGIAAIEFFKHFLRSEVFIPRLNYLTYIFEGIYLLVLIFTMFGLYKLSFNFIDWNALMLSIYMLVCSFIISRQGYRPAKFFLFAWSFFLIGIILFVLKNNGIIEANVFTNNTLPIGSALETILLSFALADKINILSKEKEESQRNELTQRVEKQQILEQQAQTLKVEIENATHELKEMQSQLVQSEKMASLGQLTAGIAHEINNPINFVKSNVRPLKRDIQHLYELIEKYDSIHFPEESSHELEQISAFKEEIESDYLKEEITTLLAGIDEGASRTAKIVEGLKDFSRIGNTSLQEYDLVKGLESSLTILNNRLTSSKILIERNFSSPLIVECFPDRINQVFMNILDNAIDAFDEVNGTKTISIDAEKSIHEVNISITDNGIGMSPEIQNRIFDPFYTSKDVGSGTGLGLSIAYGIMQDHNGSIEVYSEEGKGTTFIIKFTHDNETQNSIR